MLGCDREGVGDRRLYTEYCLGLRIDRLQRDRRERHNIERLDPFVEYKTLKNSHITAKLVIKRKHQLSICFYSRLVMYW